MMFDRLTALVVDDQELMRSVTVNQLRSMGWAKVLSARNGADALRILRGQRVDAVLADWNMPVMNGLELLRAVRGDAKLAHLPYLMITSETERSRIQDVIAAGVSGLLVKPYNLGVLRGRLERAMSSGRLDTPRNVLSTPQDGASARRADPADPESQFMQPIRILVVDDQATSLAIMTQLFKEDYEVTAVNGGMAALKACRSDSPPDLALMDVNMPEMDGFEAVRRMRDNPSTANIPVIFITADNSEAARLKGMELGAVDFVHKSTNPRDLRQRVRNFLRFVEMRKHLQADYDAMLENARIREEVEHITRHDLKGSLSGIVGMVQALAADESMAERHVEQLKLVEQTAQQSLRSVNMAGEMFKIETGRFKLTPRPVPIGDMLRSMAELARTTYAEREIGVVIDTDVPLGQELPMVDGDEALCHSLFQNLIKNACEAAPRKTKVLITLKDETPLRFLVQNKGVVAPEIRDTFFDKFVTHGKETGSGLGTYSARLLAMAQKGSIDMDTSDENNLTTLTVWLPRHVHSSAEPLAPDIPT